MNAQKRVLPTVNEVRHAAERIAHMVPPSPLTRSQKLSANGIDIFLKREFLNPTGSFKIRGACNALTILSSSHNQVVASSAGNHGLGVAYAAARLNMKATLFVPHNAPSIKKDGIRSLGANVNDSAPNYDAAMALAQEFAHSNSMPFVNPCSGIDLLAGQGTIALELLNAEPRNFSTVVICTGGGGLLGGCGAVLRALAPNTRIVAVQSTETAAITKSVLANHVVTIPNAPTIADGLAGQIDEDALFIAKQCADDFILVTEDEIADTIAWLWHEENVRVEGAGAVALAAIKHEKIPLLKGPVVATVTGGNIDIERHQDLVNRFPFA